MLPTDTLQREIVWNRLREPLAQTQWPQDYLSLLAALDDGWFIHGPAHFLCLVEGDDYSAYLFTLGHPRVSHTLQLAVFPGSEVERFLCEEGIAVIGNGATQGPRAPRLVC